MDIYLAVWIKKKKKKALKHAGYLTKQFFSTCILGKLFEKFTKFTCKEFIVLFNIPLKYKLPNHSKIEN